MTVPAPPPRIEILTPAIAGIGARTIRFRDIDELVSFEYIYSSYQKAIGRILGCQNLGFTSKRWLARSLR